MGHGGARAQLAEDRLRLPAGLSPAVDLLLGDVDGDGRIDLVRVAAESVDILLQDGAGRFAANVAQQQLIFRGAALRAGAFGRIRVGGTLPDLWLTRTQQAPLGLLNQGGAYSPAPLSLPPPPSPVAGVLVGDLDRIAPDDMIVLPELGRPQLLLGQLASYRDASQMLSSTVLLQSPLGALFDFDNDTDLDVLLASGVGSRPYMLENTGTFMRQLPLPIVGAYSALATGDFDGDGRLDIAFARTSPLPLAIEFALNRVTGLIAYSPAGPFPLDAPVMRLCATDLQGDGKVDLVVLQSDGRVRVGLNDGQSNFQFNYVLLSLDTAPRSSIAIGDFEGDGDVDMVVGGGLVSAATVRDSVMLGHGRTATWFDTEAVGFPIGAFAGSSVGAAVDSDGDAELDLVGYTTAGRGFAYRNDGTARFAEAMGVAPTLPMRDVRGLLRASIDTPDRDLVVVSSSAGGTAAPPGLRVLVNRAGAYLDVTGSRLPSLVQRGFADVGLARVFQPTTGRRVDDMVLADGAGNLSVLINQSGTFADVPGAFAPNIAAAPVRVVLAGDLNRDARSDVVLVENGLAGGSLQVYLRTATNVPPMFVLAPRQPAVLFGAVRQARLADFDGDNDLDIIAVLESGSTNPMLFLAGDGTGDFVDATSTVLPTPLPPEIVSFALLPGPRLDALLLSRAAGEPLLLLRRVGSAFAPAEEQPIHGSSRATDLVVADFDTDGDSDCAVLTPNTRPGLLLGTNLQFASTVFQGGREIYMRARGPHPAAIAAWLWSPAGVARVPVPGFGILRLASPVQSLAVFPIGPRLVQEIGFQAPSLPADVTLYFQLALFDPGLGVVRLSNLEPTLLTAR